jgi:hypothetical protein
MTDLWTMMTASARFGRVLPLTFAMLLVLGISPLTGQAVANNPYRAVYGWGQLPEGREWGVASGIVPDPDGHHIWVLERCGGDDCAGSDVDPVLKFDLDGNLVSSFGGGMMAWPHGFFVDREGNVWVTEGAPVGDRRGEAGFRMGRGHQVFKFSRTGELLMTLGEAGVAGDGPDHFNGPAGVAIAPNGDIWIVDGHRGGNNRLVRFSRDGKFLQSWGGGVGSESAERYGFNDPHDIAIDSQGRIFVADRGNNRIQIFDSEGEYVHQWTQFGRPSGIFIDADDVIYVGDGMSNDFWNPGWERGIRIGDARTGWITAFIPDPEVDAGSGVEFLAADSAGNIYAGEVGRQRLIKYVRIRP